MPAAAHERRARTGACGTSAQPARARAVNRTRHHLVLDHMRVEGAQTQLTTHGSEGRMIAPHHPVVMEFIHAPDSPSEGGEYDTNSMWPFSTTLAFSWRRQA